MSAADFLSAVEARANDPYLAPAPWRSHAWTNGHPSNGPDLHHVEVDGWTSLSHAQAVVAETEYSQDGAAAAEFIAHARTDVPRLVAALRAVLSVCDWADETVAAHDQLSPVKAKDHRPCEAGARQAQANRIREAIESALGES